MFWLMVVFTGIGPVSREYGIVVVHVKMTAHPCDRRGEDDGSGSTTGAPADRASRQGDPP